MKRAAILLFAAGCATTSSLPLPRTGPHVGDEPLVVPFPPPPAKVQVIPARPEQKDLVWIDGQWLWKGRRWAWQDGQWEEPLKDGYYALPTTVMLADGSIAYFAGDWHRDSGAKAQ